MRLNEGDHLFSLEKLYENAQLRSIALLETARSSDLDIEIRIGDPAMAKNYITQVSANNEEYRFLLPRTDNDVQPPSFILEGDIPFLIGDELNDAWERARPLPIGLIEKEMDHHIEDLYEVRIQEVYYNTYLADDPDEYIAIMNYGSEEVDLSGFTVTDDEGQGISSDGLVLLDNITLQPEEMMFLTRDLKSFRSQNGDLLSLEYVNDSSVKAFHCYGNMRLANSNDTVSLRDPSGNIIDTVSWGSIDIPNDIWNSYSSGTWYGDPCPDVGWGRILTRSSEIDTNTMEDWLSLRPRYRGQSRFDPFDFKDVRSVSLGICPDSGSQVLDSILNEADQEILVNVYEMTSNWITSRLIGLKGRGVIVKVLLEGNPVGSISLSEKACIDRMVDAGIEIRLMTTDPSIDVRDRYRYDHAKYVIVDKKMVLVSSDNFKDSSFPPINERSIYGTRGWVISLHSEEIADDLCTVFYSDWSGPDIRIIDPLDFDPIPLNFQGTMITAQDEMYCSWNEPLLLGSGGEGSVIISPDHISIQDNSLLTEIRNAEYEILVELMDIDLDFQSNAVSEDGVPGPYLEDWTRYGIKVMNPYVKALLDAAEKGVDVKILLDGSDFNGDGIPENLQSVDDLKKIVSDLGLVDNFKVLLQPSSRFSINDDISMIHNKGMIIDRRSVWISSFNWGPTSGLENREVGILFRSEEAAEYLRECVLYDMGSSLQSDLDLKKEWARGEFESDELVFIEVCLRIEWEGDSPVQFELVNKGASNSNEDYMILDCKIIDEPFDGHLMLSSDASAALEDGTIILRISRGELYSDLMAIEVSQSQQRSTDHEIPWYANGWTPIVIILIIAILISLLKAFIPRRGGFEEE
jgi:phosphatidylserine/phosphatidylglycerophosphate/cardiolipin synthase-like enzyme